MYELRRCRSHNVNTSPREFETIRIFEAEEDVIVALEEAKSCIASGDTYHMLKNGEPVDVDYDCYERPFLVPVHTDV